MNHGNYGRLIIAEALFSDGVDTAGLTLIIVTGESTEYGDTPGGKVVTLISLAKSVATGKPAYDVGDNESVTL